MTPRLPTLLQFWNRPGLLDRADVREPGFQRLYVRKGRRYLRVDGEYRWFEVVLQIASLAATRPRRGAFKRLVAKIERNMRCHIFVENVLNPGFSEALPKLGFTAVEVPPGNPPCFIKLAAGVM